MTKLTRRSFLRGMLRNIVATALLTGGWLKSLDVVAKETHSKSRITAALRSLYDHTRIETYPGIHLDIPARVEDGANVPVTIEAEVNGANSLAILIENNPRILAALIEFPGGLAYLRTRLKLAESSDVYAVVQANDRLLAASTHTMIAAAGGCSSGEIFPRTTPASEFGKMRMRVRHVRDRMELAVLIRHPMETGFRVDPDTKQKVPAQFINELEVLRSGTAVVRAKLGTAISRNPLLVFAFPRTEKKGEILVSWKDNTGQERSESVVTDG